MKTSNQPMPESIALRYSDDKPRLDLVPEEYVLAAARAFTYGAQKYSAHNWRNGLGYEKLMPSLLRHLFAYNDGEDTDPESGLSHLDHACASLAMLVASIRANPELAIAARYKPPMPTTQPDIAKEIAAIPKSIRARYTMSINGVAYFADNRAGFEARFLEEYGLDSGHFPQPCFDTHNLIWIPFHDLP